MAPVLFIKAEGRLRKVKGEITCFYDIDKNRFLAIFYLSSGWGGVSYDT